MAKVLTDFSIAAILQLRQDENDVNFDDKKTTEEEEKWTRQDSMEETTEECCEETEERKKKTRTVYTRQQIQRLENAFDRKKYFSNSERQKLATDLNLSETQVKIWLQNRRNKWKKQLGNHDNRKHGQTYQSLLSSYDKHFSFMTRPGRTLSDKSIFL